MKLFCEASWAFWTWQHQSKAILRDFLNFLNLTNDNVKNERILRDFLIFRSWQHQKWRNSARILSKMESWVQSWRPRANAFCDISTPVSKVLRLPRRSEARSYEVLHLSRKIIFPKLKIWCSKMQHFSGNQRPDPNISDEHVSCTAPATENVSLQILFKCPTPATVLKCYKILTFCWLLTKYQIPCTLPRKNDIWTSKSVPNPSVLLHFWLRNVLRATTACTFSTSQVPKVVRTPSVLYILTCKRASRHNGVHFFDMSTSKRSSMLVCFIFIHFDLETSFVPQRHALFRHVNFQNCSDTEVVLCILTSNCASRHKWRATFHLSFDHMALHPQPTFRALWSHKSLKNTVFRDFPTFSRTWIFFLLRLSLFWFFLLHFSSLLFSHLPFSCLTLPISAFHLWRLSEVWLLSFLRSTVGRVAEAGTPHSPGLPFLQSVEHSFVPQTTTSPKSMTREVGRERWWSAVEVVEVVEAVACGCRGLFCYTFFCWTGAG